MGQALTRRQTRIFSLATVLLALDRLGRLAFALSDCAAADVEVQLAVVVEPEAVREKVIDHPLRPFEEGARREMDKVVSESVAAAQAGPPRNSIRNG